MNRRRSSTTLHCFPGMWVSPAKMRKCYPPVRKLVLPVCREGYIAPAGCQASSVKFVFTPGFAELYYLIQQVN
jgi:hypothetical protein